MDGKEKKHGDHSTLPNFVYFIIVYFTLLHISGLGVLSQSQHKQLNILPVGLADIEGKGILDI